MSLIHPKLSAKAFYAIALLLAAFLLGGGTRTGFLGDVVLQLFAIPLFVWTLLDVSAEWRDGKFAFATFIALALPLLPLLQLISFPVDMFGALPARSLEAEVHLLLGAKPSSLPITVSAQATILSALSLISPVALFLATRGCSLRERRVLILVIVAFGIFSAFLGLLQLSQGRSSALRVFQITNLDEAVGLFANRNHYAALLNCALLLTVAWTLVGASENPQTRAGRSRAVLIIAGATVMVILMAGVLMARSRAGMVLMIFALGASALLLFRLGERSALRGIPLKVLFGAALFGFILSVQSALYGILDRWSIDPLQESRAAFAQTTVEAARNYFPFGSGVGTFMRVFPNFQPIRAAIPDVYVNRAHNDVLEFLLEAGALGGIILALGSAMIVLVLRGIWRRDEEGIPPLDGALRRSAGFIIVLLALHSFLDYPLRTSALMCLAAVAAGLTMSLNYNRQMHVDEVLRASGETVSQSPPADKSVAAPRLRPPPTPDACAQSGSTGAQRSHGAWGGDIDWPSAWRKPGSDGERQ